jgi:serine/threonine protein kinase
MELTTSSFPGKTNDVIGWSTKLGKRVGRGRTSTVYKLKDVSTPTVIKIYRWKEDCPTGYFEEWEDEIRHLIKFKGAYFPRILDALVLSMLEGERVRMHLCVVMEDAGVSISTILARDGPLSASTAATVARNVCSGLALLHAEGMTHTDVKPGNILWNGKRARIVDLAAIIDATDEDQSAAGTTSYWAPEFLYSEPREPHIDMWALGVVYFEMVTGDMLFDAYGDTSTIYGGDLDDYGVPSIEDDSDESSIENADDTTDILTSCRMSRLYHRILGSPPKCIRDKMRGYFDKDGRPHLAKEQEPLILEEYLSSWPDIDVSVTAEVLRGLVTWDPADRYTAKKARRLFIKK